MTFFKNLLEMMKGHAVKAAFVQIVCLVLGVFSGVLTAHLLSPNDRGLLSAYLVLPGIMGSLLHFGAPQAVSYLIATKTDKEIYIASGAVIAFVQAIFCTLFISIFLYYISPPIDNMNSIILICSCSAGMILVPYNYNILRSLHFHNSCNYIQIGTAASQIIILLILWRLSRNSPINIAIASVIIPTLGAAIGFLTILREISSFRTTAHAILEITVQGFRYYLPIVSFLIYQSIDRPLALKISDLHWVGLYSVAYSIANPLFLIPDAVSQVAFVEIANPNANAKVIVSKYVASSLLIVTALSVLLAIFSHIAVRTVFGYPYRGVSQISYYLLPALSLSGINRMIDKMLHARGGHGIVSVAVWALVSAGMAVGAWQAHVNQETRYFLASMIVSQIFVFTILFYRLKRSFGIGLGDIITRPRRISR